MSYHYLHFINKETEAETLTALPPPHTPNATPLFFKLFLVETGFIVQLKEIQFLAICLNHYA